MLGFNPFRKVVCLLSNLTVDTEGSPPTVTSKCLSAVFLWVSEIMQKNDTRCNLLSRINFGYDNRSLEEKQILVTV